MDEIYKYKRYSGNFKDKCFKVKPEKGRYCMSEKKGSLLDYEYAKKRNSYIYYSISFEYDKKRLLLYLLLKTTNNINIIDSKK